MTNLKFGAGECSVQLNLLGSGNISLEGDSHLRTLRTLTIELLRGGSAVGILTETEEEAKELNGLNINRLTAYGPKSRELLIEHAHSRAELIDSYLQENQWPTVEAARKFGSTDHGKSYFLSLEPLGCECFEDWARLGISIAQIELPSELTELKLKSSEDRLEISHGDFFASVELEDPQPQNFRKILGG